MGTDVFCHICGTGWAVVPTEQPQVSARVLSPAAKSALKHVETTGIVMCLIHHY